MKRFIFLLFISLISSGLAYAGGDKVKVEVILYKNLAVDTSAERDKYDGDVDLSKADDINELKGYEVLPKKAFNMLDEKYSLQRSKDYKVIEHVAWLQDYNEFERKSVLLSSLFESDSIASGIASVYPSGSNAMVALDLNINTEDSEFPIRITSLKVTKKKKILYLDHPKYGLLLMVSPVDLGPSTYEDVDNQNVSINLEV